MLVLFGGVGVDDDGFGVLFGLERVGLYAVELGLCVVEQFVDGVDFLVVGCYCGCVSYIWIVMIRFDSVVRVVIV